VRSESPESVEAGEDKPYQVSSLSRDPVTTLERDGLMVLLQHPDLIDNQRASSVLATQFSHAALALVRDAMVSAFEHYTTPGWVAKVTDEVPQALTTLVGQLAVGPLPEKSDQMERYAQGVTASLLDREYLRTKAELLSTLQRTNAEEDPAAYRALQEQLVAIEHNRRALREE
jgi:DNA primase